MEALQIETPKPVSPASSLRSGSVGLRITGLVSGAAVLTAAWKGFTSSTPTSAVAATSLLATDELAALASHAHDEMNLYKNAVFFGHMNPDVDSIGMAYGAAEFFGGTAACPMTRTDCPNPETKYLMEQFAVGLEELPELPDVPDLANRKVVLVDFNEVAKGPKAAFGDAIPSWVHPTISNQWQTPPVVGVMDHHSLQLGDLVKTSMPDFYYEKLSNGLVVETHAFGCGSSIMALKWRESGRTPSKKAAGLMLGAILSDNLGLQGPNTVQYDRDAVDYLAPIAGIADVNAMWEAQAEAKSAAALNDHLFDVMDGDLKLYTVVAGRASLVIGSVEVYGDTAYDGIMAKSYEQLHGNLTLVKEKYLAQAPETPNVYTYVWIVDTKTARSRLLMLGGSNKESCIAIHALDKAKVPVLPEEKECRPDSAAAEPHGKDLAWIGSGTCQSRKSQLQPSLTRAVEEYEAGKVQCPQDEQSEDYDVDSES